MRLGELILAADCASLFCLDSNLHGCAFKAYTCTYIMKHVESM